METGDLASALLSMSASKTQVLTNVAVLKKQIDMEKTVLDILDPTRTQAPAPAGTGQVVDKTA